MEERHGVGLPDYASLWRWSIESPETFWREVWEDGGVIGKRGERTLVDGDRMPGAKWFPDARLNFAQNLLERRAPTDAGDAFVFWGEDKVRRRMSHRELHADASRVASALGVHGLSPAIVWPRIMPNMPESIVGMFGDGVGRR